MEHVLLTGASGQLGSYLLRELRQREVPVTAWSGSRTGPLFGVPLRPVDLADPDAVARAFAEAQPTVVIHTAALATVAQCCRAPEQADRINRGGTAVLSELAARSQARLLLVSTDLVFSGEKGWYRESDSPGPLSVYGRTKAAAEQAVLTRPRQAVVRVSLLFGPSLTGRPSFFEEQRAALRERRRCPLFEDEWRTPLGLCTAAQGLWALAQSDFQGLLHLGGPERMTRLEMGCRLASLLGSDPSVLEPVSRLQVASPEPRPRDTSLDATLWRRLFPKQEWPTFEESLSQMTT
ncbi:MAG: SDR family oxidoreductase [Planctomycetes bacterium]|nr:SDR family oxidoreductase [Planctomycetota bacterium]